MVHHGAGERKESVGRRLERSPAGALLALIGVAWLATFPAAAQAQCERTVTANVAALDQVFFWNRLGAVQPHGMIYALERDLVELVPGGGLVAGNVILREDRRPRPMVLRMNVGDCLQINFRNLLDPERRDDEQVATRDASIHVIGLQLVNDIADDGSNVGANGPGGSGVVPPGGSATYTLLAEREGEHVLFSAGAATTGEGDGGQMNAGLFGAVQVEPRGSTWYRSQVTAADLDLAEIGQTAQGHPLIDYDAVYPAGHPQAGRPIFRMLDTSGEIVHTDLTAIIAGPFADPQPPNPVYPNRDRSFREFTIMYHDEVGAVQAFDIFEDPVFEHTLHCCRDAFAHNYGTGGIGAEILANRFAVGPMRDCVGCKYEEFFLSSWAVADPAQVVDVPANACVGDPQCRAGEALYPDDPSNVYHAYLRDHVKFRIMHGGSKEHHIHHQHTHQWVFAPDSDESTYLDSQSLGPGASYTLEMTYNGSGNRNAAVGDSIFHCHFYPHFAQGMWSLWRVHDVFEDGTRMLPDGEIVAGTPIPALVPIPGLPMAPMPGAEVTVAPDPRLPERGGQVQINGKFVRDMTPADLEGLGNPGYPFWVPGIAGSRPPHPPLDTIDTGGLARHVLAEGEAIHVETRLDFTKELEDVDAIELAEAGEPVEEAAMQFHEQRFHPSFRTDGAAADFIANGLPRVPGAPYAEPCMLEGANREAILRTDSPRLYKAADIQLDVIFNKAGWHFPQERMLALWGDVQALFDGEKPPEPFFFRANTNDCITYQLTNLVPNIYELDDFQVRTPTDVLGQHIHLVKFDVLASDGAANGWNYEDGGFSPDEVRERMHAIRTRNLCVGDEITGGDPRDGSFACPIAQPHPFFGSGPGGGFLGAQTTVQRWFADDVLNLAGEDRTLRTVFTHDHFGPSTHQQAGLYAGLLIEPENSVWRNPETGEILGSRFDGGPTSWRVDILTEDSADSYREFMFEMQDFALAYFPDSHPNLPEGGGPVFPLPWDGNARQPGQGFDNPPLAVNPPGVVEVGLPFLLARPPDCPGGVPVPCPEGVSADDPGTMVLNYRSEPLALRVRDPQSNTQAAGIPGDLSYAFRSGIQRADPALNVQPAFYPALTEGVFPTDPFTPLMRAYEGDRVQIRLLNGATEEGHNTSVHGLKWLFEPSWENSGWRNSQMHGISEHFEFEAPVGDVQGIRPFADYLHSSGSSTDDLWTGLWSLLRVYNGLRPSLLPLPNNPDANPPRRPLTEFIGGVCPSSAPLRLMAVEAYLAQDILPGSTLVYNQRASNGGPLHDPTAILYVRAGDVDSGTGQLKPGVPVEPLVLRANAGDCIILALVNRLPDSVALPDLDGFATLPMVVDDFNTNQVAPSPHVGLHAQLLDFDVTRSDGANVGFNPIQTAGPGGGVRLHTWYAGDVQFENGDWVPRPIELGVVNLMPSDPIKHPNKGAIGALVIEPKGASWVEDAASRASATVSPGGGPGDAVFEEFREFVVLFQNFVNMRFGSDVVLPTALDEEGEQVGVEEFLAGDAVPNTADAEDAEDSAQKAFNYATEPMWFRFPFAPDAPLGFTRDLVITDILTNDQVGGDPETPVFTAAAGTPVRFRVAHPGGNQRNNVFAVHGHIWQREPYVNGSTQIGDNPLSLWQGSRSGIGPSEHFDALLENGAGGAFGVTGDYLYRDQASFQFSGGLWGILRVEEPSP